MQRGLQELQHRRNCLGETVVICLPPTPHLLALWREVRGEEVSQPSWPRLSLAAGHVRKPLGQMLRDSSPVWRGVLEAPAQPVGLGPGARPAQPQLLRHLRQAGVWQPHTAILIPSIIVEGKTEQPTLSSHLLTRGIIGKGRQTNPLALARPECGAELDSSADVCSGV